MEDNKLDLEQLIDFNFREIDSTFEAPVFKEDKDRKKDVVPYADKEGLNYPDKLIYDYNNCALHNAIITSKVFQIAGKGFVYDTSGANVEATEEFFGNVNEKEEDMNEVLLKSVLDLQIFGAFALLVTFTKDFSKIAQIENVDWSKLRVSRVNSDGKIPGYYYSFNWDAQKPKKQFIPIYNPTGAKDQKLAIKYALTVSDPSALGPVLIGDTTQIFVYQEYKPGTFYYPLPSYVACLGAIESDIMACLYGVNSWKNGMNTDYLVAFIGNYTQDQKKEHAKKFYKMHTGAAAVKKPIITFAKDAESVMKVIPTSTGRSGQDRGYTNINEYNVTNILSGHRVTSPLLMGIKTPGQLGASQELQDAQTIFYQTVIQPIQFEVAKAYNKLLAYNEFEEVSIEPVKFIFGGLSSGNPLNNNTAIGSDEGGAAASSGSSSSGGGAGRAEENIDKPIDQ